MMTVQYLFNPQYRLPNCPTNLVLHSALPHYHTPAPNALRQAPLLQTANWPFSVSFPPIKSPMAPSSVAECTGALSWLKIARLVHTISTNEFPPDKLVGLAKEALGLMDLYKGLHPYHTTLIGILDTHNVPHSYDVDWIVATTRFSETLTEEFKDTLKTLESNDYEPVKPENTFLGFRRVFISLFAKGDYHGCVYFAEYYASVVQFLLQPSDKGQLTQNHYVEFLFYQYMLKIYDLLWFPPKSAPTPTNDDKDELRLFQRKVDLGTAQPQQQNEGSKVFRGFDSLFKKANFYYTKNETLFNIAESEDPHFDELRYYWLLRWMKTLLLVKQNKFKDFLTEFSALALADMTAETPGDVLKLLVNDFDFKSEALVLVAVASIMYRPFRELSFINSHKHGSDPTNEQFNNMLVDLFLAYPEGSVESAVYELLVGLSRLRFLASKKLLSNDLFISGLRLLVGYLIPTLDSSNAQETEFFKSLLLTVDLKTFLLILSVTRRISRRKLLQKLGYTEEHDGNELTSVSCKLILLISVLKLGELNIGFNVKEDYFFNYGTDRAANEDRLNTEIEAVQRGLEAEAVANLMKGVLVEKLFM